LHIDAATSVDPLPINGSSTVSPTKEKSFMHLNGSSTGKGAGWPIFVFLSPLNVHNPFVQAINSSREISDMRDPLVFFHVFLYRTTINSTGEITKGADALNHDPHAVLREIFPSFQTIVVW
jgi:hypothetical protein